MKLTSHKTTVQEETVQVNTEDDQRKKDVEKRHTDVVTSDSGSYSTKNVYEQSITRRDDVQKGPDVIAIESTPSESFRKKNVVDETDKGWSRRIQDESDSSFHKHQTDGGTHSSTTEESWTLRSGRLTQLDTSTTFRSHERTGPTSPSTLQGGMRCQAVDSEQLNVCSHEEKRRFYIRAVIDPRNGLHLSVREVSTQ